MVSSFTKGLRAAWPLLALAGALACEPQPRPPKVEETPAPTPQAGQVTAGDVKAKMKEALGVTAQFTRQKADAYEQELSRQLAELQAQAQTLRRQAETLKEGKEKVNATLDSLDRRAAALRQELDRLKGPGGEALERSRERLNETMRGLKQSLHDAAGKVEQKTQP